VKAFNRVKVITEWSATIVERAALFPDELLGNNDCTVVGLADATGRSYSEAHALLARAGRERGQSWFTTPYECAIFDLGFKRVFGIYRGVVDLSTLVDMFPSGRLIAVIDMGKEIKHVVGIVEGKVYNALGDEDLSNAKVLDLWEYVL